MCPACKKPMVAFELEGVEIDRCVECGGTWLDAGELEAIAERAGVRAGALSHSLETAAPLRRSKRRCPRCRRRMDAVGAGDVELDRCRRGHGLWFDRGEMLRVLDAEAHDEEHAAVTSFFRDLYRHELTASSGETQP